MPVLYELGAPFHGDSVVSQHSSVNSQSDSLPAQSNLHFRTSFDSVQKTLALLCAGLALFALLSLLLQIRLSSARRKQIAPARQSPIETSPLYPTEKVPYSFEPRFPSEHTHLFEEPQQYFREREGSAASYYDLQDDLGMDQSQSPSASSMSSSSGSSKISEPATIMQDPDKWAQQQNWSLSQKPNLTSSAPDTKDSTSGIDFAPAGDAVPRRRSYTKIKSLDGNVSGAQGEDVVLNTLKIQEEIIVAEGWRRHTRVYGGGVCLACAESEKRMKSIGMSDPQAGFA